MKYQKQLAVLLSVCMVMGTPMQASASSLTSEEKSKTITDEEAVLLETQDEIEASEEASSDTEQKTQDDGETENEASSETVTEAETMSSQESVPETECESLLETETECESLSETEAESESETETESLSESAADLKVDVTADNTVTLSNDSYSLTVTICDDADTKYAEITGFKSLADSTKFGLVIPASVIYKEESIDITAIADNTFKGKTMITSLSFDETSKLSTIGESAFSGCTALAYVEFPDTVTKIGPFAFAECSKLGTKNKDGEEDAALELKLPSNLTTIGSKAFMSCINIRKVVIPKSLTTVELPYNHFAGPFYKCFRLTDITIPDGMTKIPANLFNGHIAPTSDNEDSSGCDKSTITFTIPDSVTEIGAEAFKNQTNMTACVVNDSSKLTTIGNDAFNNCSSLGYFNLREGLTIGTQAFSGCSSLFTEDAGGNKVEAPQLVLPDRMTIGEQGFEKCTGIRKIIIPKDVIYKSGGGDAKGAFYGCSSVEEIVLEEGRIALSESMFSEKISDAATLTVRIPDSLTEISKWAFEGNTSLNKIVLGENSQLKAIEYGAFQGCTSLETFDFPETLESIGSWGFDGCIAWERLVIPESVTKIWQKAFQKCTALKSVEFEVNNFYTKEQVLQEAVFKGCTALETVALGNKIKTIPSEAFSGCSTLAELEVPYGVEKIDKNVFYNCNALRTLFIPSSVTQISTTSEELAYCYQQGLKIYVEKGDSAAKTFAENNGYPAEVGIYVTKDEFPDIVLFAQMNTQRYDRNLDTRLTLRELEKIVTVDISGLGIGDMTGTQLFTSMESLDCSDNQIAQLKTDTWTVLKSLDCSNNSISNLELSLNPLEKLDCSSNCILVFDLSSNTALTDVTLGTQTGELAVVCNETYREYCLPLKEAYPAYNKASVSEISDEDAKEPADEGIIWYEAYDVPDVVSYHYSVKYGSANLSADAFVSVKIPNAGIVLTEKEYPDRSFRNKICQLLDTNQNGLISKTEERACETIDVSGAEIEDLTGIARLSNLRELVCKSNQLMSLDLSSSTRLEGLDCSDNQLTELNVSGNAMLKRLDCRNNQLKTLDTSANTALLKLLCDNNKIAKLGLANNPLLQVLECGNNHLAAIDISQNVALETLRSGSQELLIQKEKYNQQICAKMCDYDVAFDSNCVSHVIAYRNDDTEVASDSVQITKDGFLVDDVVSTITYQYKLADFRDMSVTLKLVDEITDDEDRKDIRKLNINIFSNKIYTGAETFQDIVIRDGNYMLREDIDYTVTYANNIDIGTATVLIKGIGNYCSSYKGTYEIVPEWDIVIRNIPDQIFKNKEITPAVSVKLKNKTLVAGTDYQAEYLNNVEAGVATVIITGCGNYADAGMKEVTFNITECSINKASFEIGAVTYNGEAQKPVIKANYNGELEKGKDYRVVYSKNIKAGKGTATITGIGNYTGTVNKTFTINKIDISRLAVEDIFVEGQVEYDAAGTKAAVTVKSGELVLQEGTDYTLSYSNNKAIGKATVTIKGKGSCMGKATRTFDVVPRDIADASVQVQIAVAQKDKKGKAVKPQITVTQNKKKLREGAGKDYIVKYDEEATKNKGVVKVTLIGQNQYKGEIEADFVIVDQLINKAKIKGLQNFEYDGSAKEQTKQNITVKLGNDEVPADCYQLSYENNVNIGNALMTVKVIPESCNYEYGGSVTAKYKISAVKFNPTRNEQRVSASLQSGELTYSGEALYPNETVYDEKLGVVLTKDVDYRVTYKNNVKAGNKGQVTIKGINNYSGTINLSFKVKPKDLSAESKDFEVIVKNSAYTGKTIKPRIIIMDNGMLLKQNRDYALTIKKASQADDSKGIVKEKGKYIIIVEGKGNYTGRLADCYFYVY